MFTQFILDVYVRLIDLLRKITFFFLSNCPDVELKILKEIH